MATFAYDSLGDSSLSFVFIALRGFLKFKNKLVCVEKTSAAGGPLKPGFGLSGAVARDSVQGSLERFVGRDWRVALSRSERRGL